MQIYHDVIATTERIGDTIELPMSLMFVFMTCFSEMACLNIKLTVYLKTSKSCIELTINHNMTNK